MFGIPIGAIAWLTGAGIGVGYGVGHLMHLGAPMGSHGNIILCASLCLVSFGAGMVASRLKASN